MVKTTMQDKLTANFSVKKIKRDLALNKYIYLMLIPVLANFIIFHYIPMAGIRIAFKDFNIAKGIVESPWVGLDNFRSFFKSFYFARLIKNTLTINLLSLFFGFPVPIFLAILLNEAINPKFKRLVQTVSYLPYFISIVVVVSLIKSFLSIDGLFNDLMGIMGVESNNYLSMPQYFRSIYIISGIWQGAGFGSIIYIAAIAAIDPQLYSAASIDGAGRLRQIWHITIPSIQGTIIIMFILSLGSILNSDWLKILLLQNGLTKEVSDVIQLYVYKRGLQDGDYSFATAVGFFQSLVGFILIVLANLISKKLSDTYIF